MLEEKVYKFIENNNIIENNDKIVLGVSGGPDSICMLNILNNLRIQNKIKFDIYVAHINHCLRENAYEDERYVEEFCSKIGIDFYVKHVNIKEIALKEKRGLEETGRIQRYMFFDEVLEKTGSNKIAIAHNLNDNAETMFINLFRGCGTNGLIGIRKQNGIYIRPLIEISRKEIEDYLVEQNIVARQDETNYENIYTRNKIRNLLIPFIQKEFNSNIINSMDRLSSICEEQEDYLQKIVCQNYEEILIEENNLTDNFEYNINNKSEIILNIKKFNMLDKYIQKRIILLSINKIFGTIKGIEKIHIDDVIKLCENNIGNKYLTPNKSVKIGIFDKKLVIKVNL